MTQLAGRNYEGASIGRGGDRDQCIQRCSDCHLVCLNTLRHCLGQGGKHAEWDHARTLLDCAQICQISADCMVRESGLIDQTCELCARACDACADSCEMWENDRVMQQCGEICRSCADSCRQMILH